MKEMLFYSTAGGIRDVPFKEAVLQGLAPDGGLYLPQNIPRFSAEALKKLRGMSFLELSIELSSVLFEGILLPNQVIEICEEAFNFPVPCIPFPGSLNILELFHGPTLSFKDFGARFLASLLKLWKKGDEEAIILTATSGDTGSAVGQAFHGLHGISVYVLYPKGRVTAAQKQQLTTIGHNVTAIEVDGGFEVCQDLVRQAIMDQQLRKLGIITIGNSQNIARIFPQALYYFYAYSQLEQQEEIEAIFSVPCGNFGHLISGILAKQMGLPVYKFLAATNINDEVPLFLHSGVFAPHAAYPSMAVSMDVGNPSNFPRLLALYGGSIDSIRRDILSYSVTDAQIAEAIKKMYNAYGYLLDPHSATSYAGLQAYLELDKHEHPGICCSTAHPAKFRESLGAFISASIHIPQRLEATFEKTQHFISADSSYAHLKEIVCSHSKL